MYFRWFGISIINLICIFFISRAFLKMLINSEGGIDEEGIKTVFIIACILALLSLIPGLNLIIFIILIPVLFVAVIIVYIIVKVREKDPKEGTFIYIVKSIFRIK